METDVWIWVVFNLMILCLLGIDLFLHRKPRSISVKEAIAWTFFWIALALIFNGYIYIARGPADALNFLTGFLIEKSLSVDNLFVFLVIFKYFHTPSYLQHKVLFWGVLGAIVMRGIFIALGVTIIQQFHWAVYLLGLFLVYTGIKLAMEKDKKVDFETNFVISLFKRHFPISHAYQKDRFFIKINEKVFATPLFVVLLAVEITDVVFALDSIPAILAVTFDPFIVYTSNIFAILGLRSLFFALSGIMDLFHYLHYGLALILVIIGLKMVFADLITIPIVYTLISVVIILGASILASIVYPKA